MLLRKLGKRGTAIIEYVILLSFVAVIGTSFTSDAGMGGSIKSIITNVEQLLGLAAGKGESKVAVSENAKQWSGLLNDLYGDLMDLNPNKDSNLKNIKIYKANKEDGTCIVEFNYYNHDKAEKSTTLKYTVGQDDYYLSGQSFFNFNPDGSINSGVAGGNAATRINITKIGTSNGVQHVGYDNSNGGFFVANGYFANPGDPNWFPKP